MAFFLRYSLLALLKLFQWAPLLATLNPFGSVRSIDGDSTVLERHNSLWPNPPANYLPAGFTSSNRSSCVSAHNCRSPPSSSAFAYAHLVSQHKHYLSNFVDSLVLLYSDQLIYFSSGFSSILILVALNLGLICLSSVTRLQPKRHFYVLFPSRGDLKTFFHSNSESLSAATLCELSGTGEFTDGPESVCITPDQEAYNSDSGLHPARQDVLRASNNYILHEDLDSPEIIGAASHRYNSRYVLPHETTSDDVQFTLNHESGCCHDPASQDFPSSLISSSFAGFKLVIHNAMPEDPRQSLPPVHLVHNSTPPAEAVTHDKAIPHDAHWPACKSDGEPRDGNLEMTAPASPDHGDHFSVSSSQASFSSIVPQKRSWSHTAAIGTELEEDSDSSFGEGSFSSESSGDQLALGLLLSQPTNKNEIHVTSHLPPSTSSRDNILESDSLCHSESTATPFDMHRRSTSTPVPSSRGGQQYSNGLVVAGVKRDDSPSSGSERKFDGPDSFWEAAVQERLRATATITTLDPLKHKGARNTLVELSQTATADGDQSDRSSSGGSAALSPPWSIVTRKTPCAYSSQQQPNPGGTQDQPPNDDLLSKSGSTGLASNQADSFPGLNLRSSVYAKYVPPQRRVAGELVYTVPQRMKPTPRRPERVIFGSSSPMLQTSSRSSTSSPWSPFAPRESLSPTSEAVAWKRGALFLANPPPDEFAHIDEFGNEKSWYAKTNWNTTEPDWLSGSPTERHAAGIRTVKDVEDGCQLNTHTSPQQHSHDLWKNNHRRRETFGT